MTLHHDRKHDRRELEAELLESHAAVTRAQARLLRAIAACDDPDVWEPDGCHELAPWLSARLHVSQWTARRWGNAARALPELPLTARVFESGGLSIEKVAELTRFAQPATEGKLIPWARHVSAACIRRKADAATRVSDETVREVDRERYLDYWWQTDGRLSIEGRLPPEQGAIVAKALDRIAKRMPDIIDDDGDALPSTDTLAERRADALYALASARLAGDADPARAHVVFHTGPSGAGSAERGPAIPAAVMRRLECDCLLEPVVHGDDGHVTGIGRTSRNVPPRLQRQLRQRDDGCVFPGCARRFFLHAHHIHHWTDGGPTDLENLTLVCHFHHKLVHEYGWKVELGAPGIARWFKPDGAAYEPGRDRSRASPRAA